VRCIGWTESPRLLFEREMRQRSRIHTLRTVEALWLLAACALFAVAVAANSEQWFQGTLLAAAPALAAVPLHVALAHRASVRRRRRARGCCARCGYDLRATHERCPECGRRPGRWTVAGFWRAGPKSDRLNDLIIGALYAALGVMVLAALGVVRPTDAWSPPLAAATGRLLILAGVALLVHDWLRHRGRTV
jgi:hypothetical protein